MERSDLTQLIDRAQRQDPEALSHLVALYSHRLYGLLYRLTGCRDAADDLLQETFLRLVRMIGNYQHSGRFEAWLFRIAANLARDHGRRAKTRGPVASLDPTSAAGEEPPAAAPLADAFGVSPEQAAVDQEAAAKLEAALDQLSAADREIILLRHYSELSFNEVAELLQVPLGTALARAHRALKRLRSILSEEDVAA